MTQIYDKMHGLEGVNTTYKTAQAGAADKASKEYSHAGNIDELLGCSYDKNDAKSRRQKTVSDGFDDYMKALQEREKEQNIDEASKERERRENQKEIVRNISPEELKALAMMGIDVEGARLSDIMGIVNTMRGEAHREERQQMMAEITAMDDASEGTYISGGSVVSAASGVELENVDVADVLSSKIAEKEDASADIQFTEDDFVYLIKNNLKLTDENIYKAHFSGSKSVHVQDDEIYNSMLPQLERVIAQAGYAVNEESLECAKLLLDNELLINTDNIRAYMNLKPYFGGPSSEAVMKMAEPDMEAAANKLYEDVNSIDADAVYEMSMKGLDVTVAAAKSYGENRGEFTRDGSADEGGKDNAEGSTPAYDEQKLKAISNLRSLEELRLSMTVEAASRLIKQDINIDTRELSQLVSRLKELEQQMIADSLKRNGVEPTNENIAIVNETADKIDSLKYAPAAVVATPVMGGAFTVNSLNNAGAEFLDSHREQDETQTSSNTAADGINQEGSKDKIYETARRSYEAAETKVRTDLGDSISKAFRNVDDILHELDMPVNYETQRAVRILGYNSLEITEESINDIINYDRQVNTLIDSFYPEAVMGIIKDGINPLDVPIDELNKIIAERNYNEGVTEAQNFAAYLRDIEKQGEVNAEERESYIGIYRIMNKLAKSGDREAGWLYGNSSRLTVRNLISAARSRKAAGISADIDDGFGLLEGLNIKGSRIDAQIASAFNNLSGGADNTYEMDEKDLSDYITAMDDEKTVQFMEQQGIEMTMVNAKAVFAMLNNNGGIYSLVSDILSKMKFSTHAKEDAVDEETGNIAASLTGTDIENEIMMESILESIRGETISLKYDDIRNQLEEVMYGAAATGIITSRDISAVKTVMAGFHIMSAQARKDQFQVPYETDHGISIMNLTIMHDEGRRGSINISFTSRMYGRMQADIRLSAENTLEGSLTADSSDANTMLMANAGTMIDEFAKQGYDISGVSIGQTAFTKDAAEEYQSGSSLYRAAVTAVKVLASF